MCCISTNKPNHVDKMLRSGWIELHYGINPNIIAIRLKEKVNYGPNIWFNNPKDEFESQPEFVRNLFKINSNFEIVLYDDEFSIMKDGKDDWGRLVPKIVKVLRRDLSLDAELITCEEHDWVETEKHYKGYATILKRDKLLSPKDDYDKDGDPNGLCDEES